ncbi:phenylalanine--tRNA ligase subunit beta [Odoribacter sp. OttesenSCG-928-L07]|nr:phenylalanine--tRNA ligase subunit beta [Odoribacter sp. OttesenSCG-928-L07]MDL2239323.1 phenylalanine--tRNA ligase subunit beta [Bacteroidales bacterium OttesenSCG-928-L14]MDL2240368.1 phenylalanine--tRNA ligase subunit beta [Bacteroidales bacterium OttesenSCG-928-K22]
MKISYSWLKDYVDFELSPEEIANKLTFSGLEVEGVEKEESIKGGLQGVVVGEVITCVKHPDSDHLSLTTVNVGQEEILNIVCGAPNVAAGQKVAVATIGTKLYFADPPLTIKKGKIRGAVSEGMICAEDELCIGNSHAGIMVLDKNAVPGTPMRDYLNITDEYVLEIGLTANRSDATGHIGVARDIAALLSIDNYNKGKKDFVKLHLPDVSSFKKDNNELPIEIIIDDENACPRYAGVSIKGVKVQESPEWLKTRLTSIGLKPINNIVDIGNYILFETGHPLHTFDADEILGNKIIVKKLPKDEKITTLDGIERTLTGQDLMICNAKEPMVIAGVLGGSKSGISEKTINVFIESAVFDPTTIRKTAKHHGISTDASFRYERGVDPEMTIYALKRAALLIKEIAGGTIASDINDVYPKKIERKQVQINFAHINSLIGKNIPSEEMLFILKSMDMDVLSSNNDGALIAVPTAKYDVTREADLTEEILRIYGYNNVETDNYHSFAPDSGKRNDNDKFVNKAADFLSANGFREIMNNSLTADVYTELSENLNPENNAKILNPLSKELNILRRDLLFGGLQTISYNINRKAKDLKLYEFGNIYSYNPEIPQDADVRKRYNEEYKLSILMTGNDTHENWYEKSKEVSFFSLKSIVLRMLNAVGLNDATKEEEVVSDGTFGETLKISFAKKPIAEISIIRKNILDCFDIKQAVYYADIKWENVLRLLSTNKIQFKPVPKFPEVRRDLALLVDSNVKFSDIVSLAKSRGSKLIREINLFDVYEGEKLGLNKKSYAVSFIIRDNEKTLTDNQIDKIMNQLIELYNKNLNASIR